MKITKRLPKMKLVVLASLFALASVTQLQFMSPVNASAQMPLDQVTQITTGGSNGDDWTCVLSSGAPYCWGSNRFGQLGNGSDTDALTPVTVDTSGVLAGKTITSIVAGGSNTCVIADGAVYCWGYNGYGQLGNENYNDTLTPIAIDTSGVLAGKTITEISLGNVSMCALADGAVYCWGYNGYGQLGNGSFDSALHPVAVDATGVLAGKTIEQLSSGAHNTCVLSENKVYCWGSNSYGQLGNATTLENSPSPVAIDTSGALAGKTITSVSVDLLGACVIASGQVYCWGNNEQGQIGDGTTMNSLVPVAVDMTGVLKDRTVTEISGGEYSRCALSSEQVYCWGNGQNGELGDGQAGNSTVPVAIDTSGVLAGKTITTLSRGYSHHYCVIAASQAYCWGLGLSGQLGGGLSTIEYSPVAVSNELRDPEVHSVTFSTLDNFTTLVVQGSGFGSPLDLTKRSHVSLNGTPLLLCTYGLGATAQELEDTNAVSPGIVTDDPPCYIYTVDGTNFDFHARYTRIILPSNFDTTAEGTVSVNGSANYTFNKTTGGAPDPVQPVAMIKGVKPLAEHPTIPARPTFTGVAEPFSQVTVTVHSDPISCSTTADASGNWSCTLPSNLAAGEHTVYVHVTAPDNTVTNLGPYAVTVDGQTSGVVTPDSPRIPGVPNTSLIDLMKAKNEHTHAVATQSIVTWGVTGAVSVAAAALLFMRYRRHLKRSN